MSNRHPGPPPSAVNLRLVMTMKVIGASGKPLDVARDLYLLNLDTARERGVCPDPSNDNANETRGNGRGDGS